MATKKSKKFSVNLGTKIRSNTERQADGVRSFGYMNTHGIPIFKESIGEKVKLDFLPYLVTDTKHMDRSDSDDTAIPGSYWWKKPFRVCRNVGVDDQIVVSPTTIGASCPISEHKKKLMNEGASKEEIQPFNASLRNLYLVIPRGHKDFPEVPHIWNISQFVFQNPFNEELQEDVDYANFLELDGGYTIHIRFTEASIGTNKYPTVSRIDFKERTTPIPESVLEGLPSLDDCLRIMKYRELQRLFLASEGIEDDIPDEIFDEDNPPKRKPKYQDSDDDEEDGYNDDEEEDEEPPKKTRKKKEEVEEEEEEEEDEEPPKKTRKKKEEVEEEEDEEDDEDW